MHEDKLTHDERLRLEAIAQTVASYLNKPHATTSDIISRATQIEQFIIGDKTEDGGTP